MHGYKYLPDVIQSLEEEDMERNSLDGSTKDKFLLNLKNNPDVETFATLTEFPLRMMTR